MLVKAILIGLVAALGQLDYAFGTLYSFRPIVSGVLVGLVLGDVHTGIIIGANLELLFMGAISVGAYIPPDVIVGGVLGTAFAITLGESAKTAVALAMPIAVISLGLGNVLAAVLPIFLKIADDGAAAGDTKRIWFTQLLIGGLKTLLEFGLCFGAYYAGVNQVKALLGVIPKFVLDGMGIAAGMLPAMGFAMLMRMILNKKLVPFFFLGFVLTSYAKIPVLGIAIIAIIIAIEKLGFLDQGTGTSGQPPKEVIEDDEDF